MRLVCPNCDAEYEVDEAAIPQDGRDVQCSNCGHAWFQIHPEVEADAEAEAELYDPPVGAVAEVAEESPEAEPVTAASVETVSGVEAGAAVETTVETAVVPPESAREPQPDLDVEEDEAPPPPVATQAPPKMRSLDETVLAVLREEAEREAASRRTDPAPAPAMESQTEMPLAPDAGGMAAAVRRIAKMRGLAAEPEPEAAEPEAVPAQKSRGQMFPAIEEINSSLRATGVRGQDEDDAIVDTLPDLTRKRGGFGRGFVLLVALAVVIVALYVLAPMIAERVPALAGTAATYVAAVDAARVWLDVNLRALVAMLRDLAGGQGG